MIEKIKHKGMALAVLAIAQFMVVLDATITNVALPAIAEALKFQGDAQLQWIITAYALTFGGFLLLGGRLADLFGRRLMFLAGTAIFALASLAAGFAADPTQIIIFRGAQGLGGALLAPSALSLLLTIFKEGPERNNALGIWSMVAAGGGAIGLLLGGILTEYVDWRWIFFINIPVAAIVIAAALKYLPKGMPQSKQRVDILGAVTITGSLIALVYALAEAADKGWGAGVTVTSFIVAAVLMAIFIVNELRVREPLITLSIFKRRNVSGGTILNLLVPAAMFGFFFYMSIYMQQILGYSPTVAGVANLPFTATIMVVASLLSKYIARINAKAVLVAGPLMVAAALLFFARIPVHANYFVDILPGIILMASGMAAVFVVNTMLTTSGISHKESGLVSGLLNTGQQIGGAIGLAVLTVISSAATKDKLTELQGNPSMLPDALVHGFHQGYIAAAVIAVLASIVALVVIKNHKATKKDIDNEPENEAEALAAIPGV